MVYKILIIADASEDALESVLEAFQTIRKSQPKIMGFFISCLSESFLKHLGPNILSILLKQEKETLEAAEDYFSHMDIPHHFEIINAPHLQGIFEVVKFGDFNLIILQGEFLKICREGKEFMGSSLHTITPKCPILIINESEKPSSTLYFLNSETLSKEGTNSTWKD
ncbi:MAG: hypothetical protein HXY44_15270 [Syntrophaceae bacterium]|nr:hypothetical protein [Syntrophaceae bacterium]